jgi:peptidoglycan-associated lipoprotein
MNTPSICRLLLPLLLLALLLPACAKKPAPSTLPSDLSGPVSETPVTAIPSQEVSGFRQQAVGDGANAGATVLAAVPVSGLERILFDYDAFTLSDQAQQILTRNAAFIKANQGMKVVIEGHCDERGSDEYNLSLGERRALAAKKFLISLGVPESQLTLISYGEELPLDRTSGESGWAKNRRAEFKAVR